MLLTFPRTLGDFWFWVTALSKVWVAEICGCHLPWNVWHWPVSIPYLCGGKWCSDIEVLISKTDLNCIAQSMPTSSIPALSLKSNRGCHLPWNVWHWPVSIPYLCGGKWCSDIEVLYNFFSKNKPNNFLAKNKHFFFALLALFLLLFVFPFESAKNFSWWQTCSGPFLCSSCNTIKDCVLESSFEHRGASWQTSRK